MTEVVRLALGVVGVGLIGAGSAHAWLPRFLGWTVASHRADGELSALVVRMHVYFLGLFLVVVGAVSLVVAGTTPSRTGQVFCLLVAVVFAVRAVVEVRYVGPAVRSGSLALRRLHGAAIVIWPVVSAVYVVAGVLAFAGVAST